jgi:type I restriction enzyme, S subunit
MSSASWVEVQLEDLLAGTEIVDPAQTPEKEFELWSIPAFPTGRPEIVRGAAVGSAKQTVMPGDVLLSKINPRINRVWIVGTQQGLQQIASTEWIVLRSSHVDPEFLMQTLREQRFRERFCTDLSGIGGSLTRARPQIYKLLTIRLPSLNEQRRIAVVLNRLTARVSAVSAISATILPLLDQFRSAMLTAAFRGELTAEWRAENFLNERSSSVRVAQPAENVAAEGALPPVPDTWYWAAAHEVVAEDADIVYGIVQPGPNLPDGIPYVRGLDIQDGEILGNQLRRTSQVIADRYRRAALQGGDVLLGIIRATKVAIVPPELDGANITQGTARLRPSSKITTGFLAAWLDSPWAQKWLHSKYRGIDMPGLNLKDVRLLPVPVPPLDEQHAITAALNGIHKRFQKVQQVVQELDSELDIIEGSILAKAFRGELVPQDPHDEPASVLLERIRAEREREGVGKPARRGRKTRAGT